MDEASEADLVRFELERNNFEAWATRQGFSVQRGMTGLYSSLGTNQLFSGWMGRSTQEDEHG